MVTNMLALAGGMTISATLKRIFIKAFIEVQSTKWNTIKRGLLPHTLSPLTATYNWETLS